MPIMNSFRKVALTATLAAGTACVPALQAQQVSTDWDRNASFANYHTFSIYKVQTADPLFEQRVRDEITRDLQAKGLQPVPSGGDLAVTAIGNVKNAEEYNTFYNNLGPGFGWRGWGWWGGGMWGPTTATTSVQQVPMGTMMIDVYDTNSHNLVFRGRATSEVNQKNSDKNIKNVDKAIDKIFDKYPKKS